MPVRVSLLLLSILITAGCRRDEKPIIGVVPKGSSHIFWQTVHAGAIKAAQENGMSIEWNAPALEIDSSRQIEIVDSMINRHVAGIVLAPVDRKALVSVVERAGRENIPVAIFDSGIDTEQRLTFIATDNREGGRMAARRLAQDIGDKGKVAVIGFRPGSASTMEREEGFAEEMKKHPGVTMLPLQFGMADRAKAMAVTENVLTANGDLAGLFADNESSSAGAVQAIRGRGVKSVKIVAFDANDQLVGDLQSGLVDSLILQDPFKMGYESTKAIAQKLKGVTPVKQMDSGAVLVTKADLDKPEVKALLAPDIQRYLKQQ